MTDYSKFIGKIVLVKFKYRHHGRDCCQNTDCIHNKPAFVETRTAPAIVVKIEENTIYFAAYAIGTFLSNMGIFTEDSFITNDSLLKISDIISMVELIEKVEV